MVTLAAPQQHNLKRVFVRGGYRVTRASGSKPVAKLGVPLPAVAVVVYTQSDIRDINKRPKLRSENKGSHPVPYPPRSSLTRVP